jgi:LDH2 family malate/lactate/ureidoglycolate dehydrogenase
MKRIHADKLLDFAKEVLLQVGVPGEDAQIISRSLVQANLEGIDSHGISRLPIYVKRMMENRVNVKPRIRVKR